MIALIALIATYATGSVVVARVVWRDMTKYDTAPLDFGDFAAVAFASICAGLVWPLVLVATFAWLAYRKAVS